MTHSEQPAMPGSRRAHLPRLIDDRPEHLGLLAEMLDARGWRARVLAPSGLPLLHITTGGSRLWDAQVVCDLAAFDTWWFRWRHGEHIAPATEAHVAAEQVAASLTPGSSASAYMGEPDHPEAGPGVDRAPDADADTITGTGEHTAWEVRR